MLKIPVAHNEGNYFAPEDLLKQLKEEGRIALKYIKQKDNEKIIIRTDQQKT